MSGGAFNYVSVVSDLGTLEGKLSDFRKLRDALAEYPGSDLAVIHTDVFLDQIADLERELTRNQEGALGAVWQAVEWHHSGNSGPERVLEALRRHEARFPENDTSIAARHAARVADFLPGGVKGWGALHVILTNTIRSALSEQLRRIARENVEKGQAR